ncbi:MAG: 3-oxoacyl-ACP reductase FabG [Candidatus Bathyarchaeota archaeon]|nr:3-oxoacyl-ACP reductase FabG [Candidatus Bathyarchaeota archaeon]
MRRLNGKVALVTGSSRGIGRSIALAFAEEGADVVINYIRSEDKAREVVSKINSMGRKSIAVRADVSSIREVKDMINRCVKNFGRLDILVNNAADFSVMEFSLGNPDWRRWQRMVDVNVRGMLLCSQVASKYMQKRKSGNIINIVADWAGGGLSYMLTKSAGIPLTRGLARALAPHIRVNAVQPGSIDTGWISALPDEDKEKLKESIPLKRWGQPEDIAKVAVFLASDESAYITGAVIIVDGGASINPWAP